MTFLEPTESKLPAGLPAGLREPGFYAVTECPTATTPSPVTNYPQITLSSGLVGVVVDTSIDDTLKGKCMCKAMQHLRSSAVAAMLRDPADTSRCLLDYEAASRLTDEDYEAFWKALGYTLIPVAR